MVYHNYHESMFSMFRKINAKDHVVGWYSTGRKLRENDLDIHRLFNDYVPNPVFVIIDVQPKELGIPTKAYYIVEEVKENATQKRYVMGAFFEKSWILNCVQCEKRNPTRKNELECKIIKRPQQPHSYECGYYVMKWMYNITANYSKRKESFEKCVSSSNMTVQDIDQARELYSKNFKNNLQCG